MPHQPLNQGFSARTRSRRLHVDWKGYASALAVTLLATGIGWPLHHHLWLANTNVLMLFLLSVLWVATRHSRSAAVLASLLGVAAFNFFFVPPHLTFIVSERQYFFTFAVMLATALVISALTHRVRLQAETARQRERRTAAMFALSRQLAAARTAEEIVSATLRNVTDLLGVRTVICLPGATDRHLVIKGDSSGAGVVIESDLAAAQHAFDGTVSVFGPTGTFIPLNGSRGPVGVMGIFGCDENHKLTEDQRQLAEALGAQCAVAVERAAMTEQARQAWGRVETEFLRNTLLSGVSHDLRTPLAAITGATSTLIESGNNLSPSARSEMLDDIYAGAERMERLINNLLDMTRLESGGLIAKKEWQSVQEVVGASLHRLERRLCGRRVVLNVPDHLPLVQIDDVLIEQVLINLLDNAVEYTRPGTAIAITARHNGETVEVEVADDGPGLPPGAEDRVFEKFFRVSSTTNRRGIGLGLAICRGIVAAHGGKIAAYPRPGGGAAFRFTLPADAPPPPVVAVIAPVDVPATA